MIDKNKVNTRKRLRQLLIASFSIIASTASAQDYDALFQKYSKEQAIFTNIDEQLTIKSEGKMLVAYSDVAKEKMMIGTLASGIYNSEYLFDSYFHKLESHDEQALIPFKNGYKKVLDPVVKTITDDDDDVFYDDSKEMEISFSGLVPKSLMKVNYTVSHTDLHMLPSFYFQENLPVVKSTFKVTAPKDVNLKFVIKGLWASRIKQTKEENKNSITYIFTAEDLPAFKHYADVPSMSWHALHIIPIITSYTLPHQPATEMLSDPDHLYKYLYGFIKNVNLNGDDNIGKCVATITANDKNPREKAMHIYQWVQQNMHYVAFEDSLEGFVPRHPADIYTRKFGDCKDMASIITAMCRKAGIDAYLTWIGTRSKPYTNEETPVPMVDNHMICTIHLGDEWIFMDGTHPLIPFGVAPSGLQGKEAMVAIDENKYKIIKVPESPAANNIISDSTFLSVNERQAAGKVYMDFHGYPSWDIQIQMMYKKNKDVENWVRELTLKGSNKYVQNSYQFTKSDTGNKDCRITADFKIDDYVQKIDKEYYINMNVDRYMEQSNIDTEGRNIGVFYKYDNTVKEVVVLTIPAGYRVSYLPKETAGTLKGCFDYKIQYTATDKVVTLIKEFDLTSMSIAPEQFVQYNKIVDDLNKQYKESIVLKAD